MLESNEEYLRAHRQARRPLGEQALGVIHNGLEVVVIEPAQLCGAAQQLDKRGCDIGLQLGPSTACTGQALRHIINMPMP